MVFLQRGIVWLNRQRVARLSRRATYRRGGESVEIAATLGATTVEVTDDTGATVRSPQMDVIVSAAELMLGDVAITPRIGDRIHVASADGTAGVLEKTLVYEVLTLPDGRHYRPCDPDGRMLRIHTKQVEILE